jgi:hypothetical protein
MLFAAQFNDGFDECTRASWIDKLVNSMTQIKDVPCTWTVAV